MGNRESFSELRRTLELISNVLKQLKSDLEKLRQLDHLKIVLKDEKLFYNTLFDILPESSEKDYNYTVPRSYIAESALLIRPYFVDNSNTDKVKLVKQALRVLENSKILNGDPKYEDLKFFIFDLYCRELANIDPLKIRKISKKRRSIFRSKLFLTVERNWKKYISRSFLFILGTILLVTGINNRYYPETLGKTGSQLYVIGGNYERGEDGYEKDIDKAIYFYERAANKGVPGAAERLKYIYQTGSEGVRVDLKKAKYYGDMEAKIKGTQQM